MRLLTLLSIASLVAVSACASTGRPPRGQGTDPYIISAGELDKTVRYNLYDVVMELRPRWFTRNAAENNGDPYVYVQDQLIGTSGALRRFNPEQVDEVRYLSPTEAQVRFGQRNHGRAAIIIRLTRD